MIPSDWEVTRGVEWRVT